MREETFGPTIPIVKVADVDEAVRLANDSMYGLSASVWTSDRAKAVEIARRLEAGAVNVNDVYSNLFAATLPHGGWKASGAGTRLGGAEGIHKYMRQKAITEPRFSRPKRELLWYPYRARRSTMLQRALHLIARYNVSRWLRR
jgi:betaine-aldehyde dehydrogenase